MAVEQIKNQGKEIRGGFPRQKRLRNHRHSGPVDYSLRQGVPASRNEWFPTGRCDDSRVSSSAALTRGCSSGRFVEHENQMNATIAANAPEKTSDHRHPHRWMMLATRSGAITPPAPTPPSKKLLPNPRSRGGVHHATILHAIRSLT